ncbi:Sec-independent protein translocase protein TatB [Gluconacetobacter entanii]|uniref:Sec-independent protein translocase protein TatB n=1 Tax=Gluconacetobacter entanii TaxID=108528 RepID=UPI001C932F85|nr:Sec-independent protein translocase protein TatB [Gluconacetobacter entanii]MBY4640083.1 Sec-independent protein translocase protein TatB [Gluconacetobacter entanii]MCW4579754.1 Sec-independent protein translocase protein TatB [Gluconacetobacter entanii]MCW4583182.1 Sec-independent protein translocase protein TatB [Gluconacetobacter entanii]MCW4586550.1 Sec-independent protein translocase protein TatB [Gluconacetobacter entanii]
MFDFAWSEFALIGAVGLLLIGPKDMPVAIRTVTGLIKKARKMAAEFQTHVDEMVREADLTEARDQLGRLRRMNVRDQIMRAVDGDGSLRRTLDERPLDAETALSPPTITPPPPAGDAAHPPLDEVAMPSRYRGTPTIPSLHDEPVTWPVMAGPPAPDFVPPQVARRIADERARLHPPAFLPPVRVIHAGHRVAPARAADTPSS